MQPMVVNHSAGRVSQKCLKTLWQIKPSSRNRAWNIISIDGTQDPNKFWVEAIGSGEQQIAGCPEPTKYENHYVICFKMKDGLILEMREINNPLKLMMAFGVELPKMPDAKQDTEQLLDK